MGGNCPPSAIPGSRAKTRSKKDLESLKDVKIEKYFSVSLFSPIFFSFPFKFKSPSVNHPALLFFYSLNLGILGRILNSLRNIRNSAELPCLKEKRVKTKQVKDGAFPCSRTEPVPPCSPGSRAGWKW